MACKLSAGIATFLAAGWIKVLVLILLDKLLEDVAIKMNDVTLRSV